LGYHPTVVPAAIQRNILKTRVGTPLTPRTKQKLHRKIRSHFEFQTMVIELRMEINASLLDVLLLRKQWLYCLMFAPEIKEKQCK
jgi:glycine dehydrogenase